MDILAPVLAYLTCVAGIVGAFLVSFYLVFSPPNQPAIAQHNAALVSVTATKSSPPVDAKKPALRGTVADNPPVNHAAPTTQKREDAPQTSAARGGAPAQASTSTPALQKVAPSEARAGDARAKGKITRAQWRQIVDQERRRRLAYQQNGDFESRFLGYAD
jgi:hypothetical protein